MPRSTRRLASRRANVNRLNVPPRETIINIAPCRCRRYLPLLIATPIPMSILHLRASAHFQDAFASQQGSGEERTGVPLVNNTGNMEIINLSASNEFLYQPTTSSFGSPMKFHARVTREYCSQGTFDTYVLPFKLYSSDVYFVVFR